MKTVQKCLNKSIANRTITKQETVCQIGKLPLNNASYSTTFISKYTKRTDHLDKSLHQYFNIVKNNSSEEPKKEFIPHYVGGGGQPSYPISINFARTEMIKHIPWHKSNPLPTLTEAN